MVQNILRYIFIGVCFYMVIYSQFFINYSFLTIPVHEMRITFTPSPSKTIDEESDNIFPVIVNGSYFGRTASGSFFPAGLWQENEKIISQMDYTDPNLSHIVSYTYSGNIIAIEENSNYKNISCKNGCIAFQAGPLIASGGILISTYD